MAAWTRHLVLRDPYLISRKAMTSLNEDRVAVNLKAIERAAQVAALSSL
jgi:hypothetical protein